MEDPDFRVNFVSLESDHGLKSGSESTRSNSLESDVTVESSLCCSRDSCADAETRPDGCSGWTDEKHNSYLNYLEKSFVRQLYCLMGGKSERSLGSHDLSTNPCKSNDQKINSGKKRTHLDASSDIYFHESPLRSHLAEPSGSYTAVTVVGGDVLCNKETNNSGDNMVSKTSVRSPAGHECSSRSEAEAWGQNFTDEDKVKKPSHSPVCKRYNRDPEPGRCSVNDQVVPLGMTKQKGVPSAKQYERINAYEDKGGSCVLHTSRKKPSLVDT